MATNELSDIANYGFPDYALLLGRCGVGLFFAISGYHKLTYPARHAQLMQTLKDRHIPFTGFMEWAVPMTEFGAGVALIVGLLTPISAMALMIICGVACVTGSPFKIIASYKPVDKADALDDLLWTQDIIYLIPLTMIFLQGGGLYSVDGFLLGLLLI